MSDANIRLARRFHMEMFQEGQLDVADEILSPNFVVHSPDYPPELPQGPEGVKMWAGALKNAFPDVKLTHHVEVADGDKVVFQWSCQGTHQNELMGIPASGQPVSISGIDIFRIENGKLVELWQNYDMLGLLRQVGAVPAGA